MNKKLSNVVLPPSDEGGGFCKAKDGGREDMKILQKLQFFLSLSLVSLDSSLVRGSQGI
jgi:hypothetical protein